MNIHDFTDWPIAWQLRATKLTYQAPEVAKILYGLESNTPEYARIMASLLVTPDTVEDYFARDQNVSRELH